MQTQPAHNPNEFAFSAPKDHIRIGCADDRLVAGVPNPNPVTVDEAIWKEAKKLAVVKAYLADGTLIARSVGKGQIEVENRSNQPIQLGAFNAAKAAAAKGKGAA